MCLSLGPDDASLPESVNDGVVHDGVGSASSLAHLVEGRQSSSPLAPLLVAADEGSVGDHIRRASLALHLLKHVACLLPLCAYIPLVADEHFRSIKLYVVAKRILHVSLEA